MAVIDLTKLCAVFGILEENDTLELALITSKPPAEKDMHSFSRLAYGAYGTVYYATWNQLHEITAIYEMRKKGDE